MRNNSIYRISFYPPYMVIIIFSSTSLSIYIMAIFSCLFKGYYWNTLFLCALSRVYAMFSEKCMPHYPFILDGELYNAANQ